jgi:hypothetical protein
MSAKQHLELTIRTATVIKSLSQLVGMHDMRLAKMVLREAAEQTMELAEFIDKCNAQGKEVNP